MDLNLKMLKSINEKYKGYQQINYDVFLVDEVTRINRLENQYQRLTQKIRDLESQTEAAHKLLLAEIKSLQATCDHAVETRYSDDKSWSRCDVCGRET